MRAIGGKFGELLQADGDGAREALFFAQQNLLDSAEVFFQFRVGSAHFAFHGIGHGWQNRGRHAGSGLQEIGVAQGPADNFAQDVTAAFV